MSIRTLLLGSLALISCKNLATSELERSKSSAQTTKPTFYYAPEKCSPNTMEGIAVCERRGKVILYTGKKYPLWIKTPYLGYASKVFNVFGNKDENTIHPLRSIATDTSVKFGTLIYIPKFDGQTFDLWDKWIDKNGVTQEGTRNIIHDGCFKVGDTGEAFDDTGIGRIDIYVGLVNNYNRFDHGDWSQTFNQRLNFEKNSSKCKNFDWNFETVEEHKAAAVPAASSNDDDQSDSDSLTSIQHEH